MTKTEQAKKLLKNSCFFCEHVSPFNEHACRVSWELPGVKDTVEDTPKENTCEHWKKREW